MSLDDLVALLPASMQQLLSDGVVPQVVNGTDTGHRLTMRAWDALIAHFPERQTEDSYNSFWSEIASLLPVAELAWHNRRLLGILRTDYAFSITNDGAPDRLWYAGNDRGGITVMLANDPTAVLKY